MVVAGEGEWTVDPITGEITLTPESTFLGDPTPVDYVAANGFGDEVTATVTITYVEPTGSFSLAKEVVGDSIDVVSTVVRNRIRACMNPHDHLPLRRIVRTFWPDA